MSKAPTKRKALLQPRRASHAVGPNLPAFHCLLFADQVMEVTSGARVVLEIVLRERLNESFEDSADEPPMFSPFDLEALTLLAEQSLDMLGEKAERLIEWAEKCHPPEQSRSV